MERWRTFLFISRYLIYRVISLIHYVIVPTEPGMEENVPVEAR
jgi:hypothetical protein